MLIFDIQRCSYHDGPGLRTVVYSKGCPLHCAWCHNPESQTASPELLWDSALCLHCGACENACKQSCISDKAGKWSYSPVDCLYCGDCTINCMTRALRLVGLPWSRDSLMDTIRKDMEYYRISGGGVTFSGGEPLVWSSELLLVVRLCKQEGISVAIETAGAVPFDDMKRLIPYVDKWIYDIKLMDSKLHQTWCGMGNELILGNLKQLTQYGVDICVKMPIIPTVNDTEKNVRQMITYLNDLCRIRDVELLPYHTLGKSKYIALGRDYPLAQVPVPTEAMMDHFNDILHKELNLESYKEASNGIPSNATHFKIERTVI